jgi:hypothetical protein
MLQSSTYVPEIKETLKSYNYVSRQGEYMVILYIYTTCWCMKLVFYERQQPHVLILQIVLVNFWVQFFLVYKIWVRIPKSLSFVRCVI